MERVLITGGTGLIGSKLTRDLRQEGYAVSVLSRFSNKKQSGVTYYYWNPENREIDIKAIETADYIIHLAGENIAEKRWTPKRRRQIIDSRVETAGLIFEKIKDCYHKPKAFISASATGYYGAITTDRVFSEEDSPCGDFLGQTCRLWEEAADRFQELGIRTVKIRTGVMLSSGGGALAKMVAPIKLGLGMALGKGSQYMPWIHINDLSAIFVMSVKSLHMSGAYNAVAPQHITNREFMALSAQHLNRPFWPFTLPSFILKIIFGEMSVMLLEGSKVSPEKIIAAGHRFHYPDLKETLSDLIKN